MTSARETTKNAQWYVGTSTQLPMYRAVRDAGVLCGMLVIGGRTNIEVR